MQKGDILVVDLAGGSATLDLSSGNADAIYQLVVQSVATTAGSSAVTVGGLSVAPAVSPPTAKALVENPLAAQAYVDRMMRDVEATLVGEPIVAPVSYSKALTKAAVAGDTKTFRVLSSLATTTAYKTVAATLKCVEAINSEVVLHYYLDDGASSALTTDQLSTLCKQYAAALATEFSILGNPSDINQDGAVIILATKVVNEIGGSLGGIVTGFFFGGDLLARSSSNPASNAAEIIYQLVPDPSGQYGTAISGTFAMTNLMPAVVPHEMQHMLSYYHHVINNKNSAEVSWLNEALSHLVEDLVGYGVENPSRIELYLSSLPDTALVSAGSPGLAERGASYLFLRFLYEQASSGATFVRSLVQSSDTGASNVVNAFGGQFSNFNEWGEFLSRWGVAVAVTDQGITSDSRYTYKARSRNSATANWEGVCLKCNAEDGERDTVLAGPTLSVSGKLSIDAGASAIYELTDPSASITLQTASANLQGVLIRTK